MRWPGEITIGTTADCRHRRKPVTWTPPVWDRPAWVEALIVRLYAASFALRIPNVVRRWALRVVRRTVVLGCAAIIVALPDSDDGGASDAGPKFLFARHRYPHGRRGEVWALPGGAVGQEPLRDALVRELQEELGLTVAVGRLLAVDSSTSDEVTFYFACQIMGGTFRPSAEVAEIQYLAPTINSPAVHRSQLRLLRRLLAIPDWRSLDPILLPRTDS